MKTAGSLATPWIGPEKTCQLLLRSLSFDKAVIVLAEWQATDKIQPGNQSSPSAAATKMWGNDCAQKAGPKLCIPPGSRYGGNLTSKHPCGATGYVIVRPNEELP
jgi:hypothetical protein